MKHPTGILLIAIFAAFTGIKESLAKSRGSLLFQLGVDHGHVAGLRSLGSLFDIELDLLTFGQVAETIALDGGEMDENVLAAFALDEAEALVTVEPLDRTDYSFRHVCLLWQK